MLEKKKKITARKKQALETKNRIHQVALQMMNLYGLENISIRDICEAAHVSTGTFYHYFSSKDEILHLSAASLDAMTERLFGKLDDFETFEEKFIYLFVGQAEHIIDKGVDVTMYSLSIYLKKPELNVFSRNRPFYIRLCQFIREGQEKHLISAHLSAEVIGDMSQAIFRGLWVDWCMMRGNFDLAEKTKLYIVALLKGLVVSDE